MNRHSNRITKVLTRVSIVVSVPISPSIILRLFAMERCNATRKQRLAIAVLLYTWWERERGRERHGAPLSHRGEKAKRQTRDGQCCHLPRYSLLVLDFPFARPFNRPIKPVLKLLTTLAPLIYYSLKPGNQFTSEYALYIYVFSKNRLFAGNGYFQVLIFEHFSEIHSKYGNELWRNGNDDNNYWE